MALLALTEHSLEALRNVGAVLALVGGAVAVVGIIAQLILVSRRRARGAPTALSVTASEREAGQCAPPFALGRELLRMAPGVLVTGIGLFWLVSCFTRDGGPTDPLVERSGLALLAGILWTVFAAALMIARRRKVQCPECDRYVLHYRVDDGLAVECPHCEGLFWPDRPALSAEQRGSRRTLERVAYAAALVVVLAVVGATKFTGALKGKQKSQAPRQGPMATSPSPTEHGRAQAAGQAELEEARKAEASRERARREAAAAERLEPAIAAALHDLQSRDEATRTSARDKLRRSDRPATLPHLVELLGTSRDRDVRRAVVSIFRSWKSEAGKTIPVLIETLRRDESAAVRSRAAWALGDLDTTGQMVVRPLIRALGDPVRMVQDAVFGALGTLGPKASAALPALRKIAEGPDGRLAEKARKAIQRIKGPA